MIKKILVAVDGSEENKFAVDTALELAKSLGALITAVTVYDQGGSAEISRHHVFDSEEAENVWEHNLDYIVRKCRETEIPCDTIKMSGVTPYAIADASEGFDMLIVGSLGRTGIKKALIGSVAETVVRRARCPVLVVRRN